MAREQTTVLKPAGHSIGIRSIAQFVHGLFSTSQRERSRPRGYPGRGSGYRGKRSLTERPAAGSTVPHKRRRDKTPSAKIPPPSSRSEPGSGEAVNFGGSNSGCPLKRSVTPSAELFVCGTHPLDAPSVIRKLLLNTKAK